MLSNKIVFYADDVYLDVVPSGFQLPASSEVRIPIDLYREKRFAFGLGQMSDIQTDIDFEPLLNIEIDDFPQTQDGTVLLIVNIEVSDDPTLNVEVMFTAPNEGNKLVGKPQRYTDIRVS